MVGENVKKERLIGYELSVWRNGMEIKSLGFWDGHPFKVYLKRKADICENSVILPEKL